MTVILSGRDLTLAQLVAVARGGEEVVISETARLRMARSRAVVEAALADGRPTYGLTTGFGVQKRVAVTPGQAAAFNRRQILEHRTGQGPLAPRDAVGAAMTLLINLVAGGSTGIRPAIADAFAAALNAGRLPDVRLLGSVGVSDLAAMADVAAGVLADVDLHAGEALALTNNAALGTGLAALALHDAARLLDAGDVAAALALEGFAANLSVLHRGIEVVRPHPSLVAAIERARRLLEGSYLWAPGSARNLQDPLTFRNAVAIQAAARAMLDHALEVLAVELNAGQNNPMVDVEEGLIISVANFESLPLAAALDYARIGLASALTATAERIVKLMDTLWSGLPTGLAAETGSPFLGLSIQAITAQSLAAEAALLAQPVSFALASTSGAEGIEDRMTMLPLGARRLAEMVGLGEGLVAIELLAAAQAVDVRGSRPLGAGTGEARELVRRRVPFMGPDDAPPSDVAPLRELVASGALGEVAGLRPGGG